VAFTISQINSVSSSTGNVDSPKVVLPRIYRGKINIKIKQRHAIDVNILFCLIFLDFIKDWRIVNKR
jgi:hypothetical protein